MLFYFACCLCPDFDILEGKNLRNAAVLNNAHLLPSIEVMNLSFRGSFQYDMCTKHGSECR